MSTVPDKAAETVQADGGVYGEIRAELARASALFGPVRNMPLTEWVCVLTEEVGEAAEAHGDLLAAHMVALVGSAGRVATAVHETAQERTGATRCGLDAVRYELVQVAAVALNMIEHIDRGQFGGQPAEIPSDPGEATESGRWRMPSWAACGQTILRHPDIEMFPGDSLSSYQSGHPTGHTAVVNEDGTFSISGVAGRFASPLAASRYVHGTARNGWDDWRTQSESGHGSPLWWLRAELMIREYTERPGIDPHQAYTELSALADWLHARGRNWRDLSPESMERHLRVARLVILPADRERIIRSWAAYHQAPAR